MYRLATCLWVSDLHTPTGFVGCAEEVFDEIENNNRLQITKNRYSERAKNSIIDMYERLFSLLLFREKRSDK